MSELAAGFQSLPTEYQAVIRQAQDQHKIAILPLQQLAGGWSGAILYLASVTRQSGSFAPALSERANPERGPGLRI